MNGSKYFMSFSFEIDISIGGLNFFLSTASQSIPLKNGCDFTFSVPYGPYPSRWTGFTTRSCDKKDLASSDRYFGIGIGL